MHFILAFSTYTERNNRIVLYPTCIQRLRLLTTVVTELECVCVCVCVGELFGRV